MPELDLNLCPSCQHPKHIGKNCPHIFPSPPGDSNEYGCPCTDAQARKQSRGKAGGFHLVPWRAITALAGIYAYGARKYAANSWREVPIDPETGETPVERYFNAMMRHVIAWREGEWFDKESGHSHLAHALWGMVALFELSMDEREKKNGGTK